MLMSASIVPQISVGIAQLISQISSVDSLVYCCLDAVAQMQSVANDATASRSPADWASAYEHVCVRAGSEAILPGPRLRSLRTIFPLRSRSKKMPKHFSLTTKSRT